MAGYCTIDDVTKPFPTFVRNTTIQDNDIQGWIDYRKARIRSALLTRGFDPDKPPVTGDQQNFLRGVNCDCAVADLGDALQGAVILQPGEYSLPAERRKSCERVIKEIMDGKHDVLFQDGAARIVDVSPLLKGVGGAETSKDDTPTVLGTNIMFGKNDRF